MLRILLVVSAAVVAVAAAAATLEMPRALKRQSGAEARGTCKAACETPAGFCKDIVSFSACTAGSSDNPAVLSEAEWEGIYNDLVATLASASGAAVSEACKNELKFEMCIFGVPKCTSATSFQRICTSRCDTMIASCTACATEFKDIGFAMTCDGFPSADCATDSYSWSGVPNDCGVGADASPPSSPSARVVVTSTLVAVVAGGAALAAAAL